MDADLAAVAALIAEPSRAAMLDALTGGEAMTAGALARLAGVAPSTATEHLARLEQGGLVLSEQRGRDPARAARGTRRWRVRWRRSRRSRRSSGPPA